jgi:site-specific recombinase XerD
MLANSFSRDSDSADSSNKGYFRSFRTMHSSPILREGARLEVVRDNMGHANIDVTQIVLRQELVGRALEGAHRHMPWLPVFATALSVQNA